PPAQEDVTEADPGHPALLEVVEPRAVEAIELGRAGLRAAVPDPGLGVACDVLHLALDHPGVEPSTRGDLRVCEPAAHPIEAVFPAAVLPVTEKLGDAS